MSDNSTIFSGSSRYASDFQSILNRAVQIASLPLTQLNNQKTTLQNQSSALSSLDDKVGALQTALTSLTTASTSGLHTATSSSSSVATVSVGTGAMSGDYSFEVVNLGTYAKSVSQTGVSDPTTTSLTTDTKFKIQIGTGTAVTITPASNTLQALADAINSSDAGVHATIVNMGGSTADYHLSLQATKLGTGAVSLQTESGTEISNSLGTGTLGSYKINGSAAISTDTRSLALGPGLTVQMLATGTTEISVDDTTDSVSNALSSFATAYNAVVDELDKHRGKAGGALAGQSIISDVANMLRNIGGYTSGTSGLGSLAAMGFTYDQTGHVSFNSGDFETATSGKFTALLNFLGTTSTGFLGTATTTLNSLEDSSKGLLKNAISDMEDQIDKQDDLIYDQEDRISLMTEGLQEKMSKADATIAALEQQVTFLTGMFKAMQDQSSS